MSEILRYRTAGGVHVQRVCEPIDPRAAIEQLVDALDTRPGVVLSSGYDYPGRYTRWDLGFCDPLLEVSSYQRTFRVRALNERGLVLMGSVRRALEGLPQTESLQSTDSLIEVQVRKGSGTFAEEERSRQPSVFSMLRGMLHLFRSDQDAQLGLYGAFGYDLTFQFEHIRLKHQRPASQRDLLLYLPDRLAVVDHQKESAFEYRYEFEVEGHGTEGRSRDVQPAAETLDDVERIEASGSDHAPGEYAAAVQRAKEWFRKGELFELVLGQTFRERCERKPSEIFRWLRTHNPAPYALLLNLGRQEHLVGASPEMYVRVDGSRVETCPISGTIARGQDPLQDAERIRELLNSEKDESELSMCTDVDRNDKSRVCEPGSVRVIGRRQIELYSRLIHTVDHVEGRLRPELDALDAFLTHTWAVTVTGAPKPAAIQKVEDEEKSPRAWYGGAIGRLGFDGNMNTGLTLRTVRLKNGVAEVRAGATLLYDSDPELEERETRVKASAFLDAIKGNALPPRSLAMGSRPGAGRHILLVDHQDSFVHTLGNYFRQTGAEVTTLRYDRALEALAGSNPHLVVLSPGPGSPKDFQLGSTIEACVQRSLPLFGVCLGLQGIAEYFGAQLGVLDYPMHGKPSKICVLGGQVFRGLPQQFVAGRYHSLYVKRDTLPADLQVTAETEDGVVMGLEHQKLPIAAVQFHPESILTLGGGYGLRLVEQAVDTLLSPR